MYSARCRKLVFTIMFLAIIPFIANLFIPQVMAEGEWVIGDTATNTYPAGPSYIPVLDGVEETAWDSTSKLYNDGITPRIAFRMKYNLTMAYCIIIVKTTTHTTNESVILLLSNHGTKFTADEYYKDAKFIDINNATEDRQWVDGSTYIVDSEQNITGTVSFDNPTVRNWTVYEFGFCYSNTNPDVDTVWMIGNTYLAKIKVGDAATGNYETSPSFAIEMGETVNATESDIFDFLLDINVITWMVFTISVALYAILGVYVFISKKKVVGLTGFTPEMLQRKKYTERQIEEKTKQFGEEVLWDEEDEDTGEKQTKWEDLDNNEKEDEELNESREEEE